jgi:hypothetical protein
MPGGPRSIDQVTEMIRLRTFDQPGGIIIEARIGGYVYDASLKFQIIASWLAYEQNICSTVF